MDVELRRLQAFFPFKEAIDSCTQQTVRQQHPLDRIWFLPSEHQLFNVVNQRIKVGLERSALPPAREIHHDGERLRLSLNLSSEVEVLNESIHQHDGTARAVLVPEVIRHRI